MEKVFCFGHRSGKHPIASLQPPTHSPNAQSLRISLPFFIHPFDVFLKVFLHYSVCRRCLLDRDPLQNKMRRRFQPSFGGPVHSNRYRVVKTCRLDWISAVAAAGACDDIHDRLESKRRKKQKAKEKSKAGSRQIKIKNRSENVA
jgi:hypothetical protein